MKPKLPIHRVSLERGRRLLLHFCETKKKKKYWTKLVVVRADMDCVNAVSIGDQRQFEQETPS